MDKSLDWKLLFLNIAKTTNAAFLLIPGHKRRISPPPKKRKRHPAVINNTWGSDIVSDLSLWLIR